MTDSPAFELKYEEAKATELSQLSTSNTVCAVVCLLFLMSGLPAMLMANLWMQLNIAAILKIPYVLPEQVFKLAYIISLGTLAPVLILTAINLFGKKIELFGSRFLLDDEGISWKAKDPLTAFLLWINRVPRQTVSWEKILFVSATHDSIQEIQDCIAGRKLKGNEFYIGGGTFLYFCGERKTGGPISVLFRLRLPDSAELRRQLLLAIRKFAPELRLTRKTNETLIGAGAEQRDLKYTEIWLKLLNAERGERLRQEDLSEGDILNEGRFKIERKLATGGQANLYLAADIEKAEQKFALKEYIVSTATDDSIMNGLEEFETESGIMQRIDHPNICKLLDMFVEDGRAYLVLEYLNNESLRSFIECQGRLAENQALELIEQVCQAVSYLHSLDPPVIHKDISPDNLIFGQGQIKLVDFSVASTTESDKIGQVVGKPAYMSVDQFRGFSRKTNDIYSIGATLYYLLAGVDPPPVTSSHPKLVNSELSDEIDNFVARCTSVSANNDSFENIDAVLSELKKVWERRLPACF